MSDPERTLPPLGARTPRNMIRWLLAWARAHTITTAVILGFLAGWLLPKLVRLLWA